jgi:hypothetical protein
MCDPANCAQDIHYREAVRAYALLLFTFLVFDLMLGGVQYAIVKRENNRVVVTSSSQ